MSPRSAIRTKSRRLPTALCGALFVCSSSALAQTTITQHDGQREFVDPGTFATNELGFLCERWAIDNYIGGLRSIAALRMSVQDMNCATPEPMQFAIFGEALGAGGQRTGTPREAQPVFITALLSGPGCPTGQTSGIAAWDLRFTGSGSSAVATGPFTTDLFTALLRDAEPAWPNTDGLSGVASVANVTQGLNPEQPSPRMLTAFAAVTSGWPRNVARCDFVQGSGGGPTATRYPPVYCAGDALDFSGVVTRLGSRDTNNAWSGNTNLGSDNYGFAARFPDPRNLNASTPPRRDSPIFEVTHSSAVQSGITRVIMAEQAAILSLGQQVELPGIGILALAPASQLFGISVSGLPGLTQNIAGSQSYMLLDLTAMNARSAFFPGQRFYAQVLDINLQTGSGALSNLVSWVIF